MSTSERAGSKDSFQTVVVPVTVASAEDKMLDEIFPLKKL
jgi:hypothetical protein